MFITQMGTSVSKISIEEMTELLLSSPNTVFVFSTDVNTNNPNICSWYNIASVKLFDIQTIIINREGIGNAAFMFDLLDYSDNINYDIGEKQNYECEQKVNKKLKNFSELYGEGNKEFYLDNKYRGYIKVDFE